MPNILRQRDIIDRRALAEELARAIALYAGHRIVG
jgi:hypothetical protein